MGMPVIMKPVSGLLEEAGDRWMASLTVAIECDGGRLEVDALRFEALMLAMRIRHLAVHPRSRDLIAGTMPAVRMSQLIERNWSSIDSSGIDDLAERVQGLCTGGDVRWNIVC